MPDPSPMLSPHPLVWPGIVVIVILAVFLTTAVLGPIILANTREELDEDQDGTNAKV